MNGLHLAMSSSFGVAAAACWRIRTWSFNQLLKLRAANDDR